MMSDSISVKLENVEKKFRIKRVDASSHFKNKTYTKNVLESINLEIHRGEIFGLVGRNGSGKSTLLKIIAGIMYPDRGTVSIDGKVASILELGMGFHPDLSGRENIYIKGSTYGFSEKDINLVIEDIIDFSGLGDQIDDPIRTYSSGMYARLAFSIASHINSDIIVIDEILSVGDAEFNIKCKSIFDKLKHEKKTIILTSHSTGTIESMCDRAAWIEGGKIVECGSPIEICSLFNKKLTESPEILLDCATNGDVQAQNKIGIMYRDGVLLNKDSSKAIFWFKKAINEGSVDAMLNLADMYYSQNLIKDSIDLYELASRCGNHEALSRLIQIKSDFSVKQLTDCVQRFCESGNVRASALYANVLMNGIFTSPNFEESIGYLEKASIGGDVNSMIYLAIAYRDGVGIKVDSSLSEFWFKQATECGSIIAAEELAKSYRFGKFDKVSIMDAIHWYKFAAKLGSRDSMYQLGVLYRDGIGVEKDVSESEKWFTLYAKQNMYMAEYDIGMMILDNPGEYGKDCVRWLSDSANGGYSNAQWQLGILYRDGRYVNSDLGLAIFWLTKAAEQWHTFALIDLSNMYFNGQGVDVNKELAFELMNKAAMAGNTSARCVVGMMCRDGIGTEKDMNRAMRMFQLSADYGNNIAIESLSALK